MKIKSSSDALLAVTQLIEYCREQVKPEQPLVYDLVSRVLFAVHSLIAEAALIKANEAFAALIKANEAFNAENAE